MTPNIIPIRAPMPIPACTPTGCVNGGVALPGSPKPFPADGLRDHLTKARAELAAALELVDAALSASTPERAGNLAHEADLKALAAADTLSKAFVAAMEIA